MRYYVYYIADGTLQSVNNVSYADTLPAHLAEVASADVGVWNPQTLSIDPIVKTRFSIEEFYQKLTDQQRYELHASVDAERVKNALLIYGLTNRKIDFTHPEFRKLFVDDLVSATDMPSFTLTDAGKL